MKYEIKWKEVKQGIGPLFYRGKVGHWAICVISRSHTSNEFNLSINLPGVINAQTYPNVEIAKAQADKLFKYWIDRLGD